MRVTPGHVAFIRMLRKALQHDPAQWIRFCAFARRIQFDGEHFAQLSDEQLNELSAYADRARQ